MAGAFERAIRKGRSGYTKPEKRRKKRQKKPQGTSIRAIEGGKGVKREQRQVRRIKRKKKDVSSVRAIEGGKSVKKEKRQAKRVQRKQARRQARKSSKLLRDVVSGKRKVKTAEPEDDRSFAEKAVAGGLASVAFDVDEDSAVSQLAREVGVAATPVPGVAAVKAGVRGAKLGSKLIKGTTKATKRVRKPPVQPSPRAPKKALPKTLKGPARKAREKARKKAQEVSAKGVARRTARTTPVRRVRKKGPKGAKARTEGRLMSVATHPAAAAPVTVGTGVAVTTGEAALEDPIGVAKTTGRTIPAIAAGLAGLAADVGTTGVRAARTGMAEAGLPGGKEFSGKEITEPVAEEVKAQADYWSKVATIAQGGEEGKRLVKEEFGLIPVASGALAGAGLAGAGKRAVRGAAVPEPKQPKGAPLAKQEKGPTLVQAHKGRKEGAERAAVARERGQNIGEAELRDVDKRLARLKRKRVGRKKDNVTLAEVVFPLMRRGMNLDNPRQTLTRLRRQLDEMRQPSRDVEPDAPTLRRVLPVLINELEGNPGLLKNKDLRAVIDKLGAVTRRQAGEKAAVKGADPVIYERARLASLAEELGVRMPEARPFRGMEDVKLRKGENFEQAARRVARDEKRQAGRVEQRAKLKLREARRVRERVESSPAAGRAAIVEALRVERDAARGLGRARGEAAAMVAKANQRIAALPKSKMKRAEGLYQEARRLEGEKKFVEADDLRRQSVALTREALGDSDDRIRDFAEEVTRRARQESIDAARAAYLPEAEVPIGRQGRSGQHPGAKLPAREKMRKGTLEAEGRVDVSPEAILKNLTNARRKAEVRRMWSQTLDEDRLNIGGRSVFTERQAARLEQRGEVPRDYEAFPLQEFENRIEAGKWESAAGLIDSALKREIRDIRGASDRKFVYLPTAMLEELKAQTVRPGKVLGRTRVLSHLQSAAMLAASPVWFTAQLVASPFAALVHHSNPVRVVRAIIDTEKARRRIIREDGLEAWRAFQSEFGAHHTDLTMRRQTAEGLEANASIRTNQALRVANKTPAGRALRAIVEGRAGLKRGGPLMFANRKYEAYVRTVTGMAEATRQLQDPAIRRVAKKIGLLNDQVTKEAARVAKMSPADRVRYLNSNPPAMRRIARGVNDTLGDWITLSTVERWPAALTVFYPFLRMSLRWTFNNTPRRHPIKTAIILNLAQQNSQELQKLLGGAPDQFYDWAQAVSHMGEDGEPTELLNTARFGPSANAIVEAMGGSRTLAAAVTAPLQPLLGAGAHAVFGTDPFTGEQAKDSPFVTIAKQMLSLPAPARPAVREQFGSDSEVAELFRRYADRGSGLNPAEALTRPVEGAQKSAELSRLLKGAEKPDISEVLRRMKPEDANEVGRQVAEDILDAQDAQKEIDALLKREGLGEDKAMEQAIDEFFNQVTPAQFGNEPKSQRDSAPSGGFLREPSGGGEGSSGGGGLFR